MLNHNIRENNNHCTHYSWLVNCPQVMSIVPKTGIKIVKEDNSIKILRLYSELIEDCDNNRLEWLYGNKL